MQTNEETRRRWEEHRSVWNEKPALRSIYSDFYRRVVGSLGPGLTIEIGAGSGNFKAFLPESVAVDVVFAPWLDLVADAHALPFGDESVSNVVLIDALHHLGEPRRFLREASRILAPGGRLALIEPAITAFSYWFYRFLHPEHVDLGADPFDELDEAFRDAPYEGNQAIPTLMFFEKAHRLAAEAPLLQLRHKSLFSLFTYPLSGGFRRWGLVPRRLAEPLLRLEERLLPVLGKWMAFRMFVVLERVARREVAAR